jgi:hypothetical protein
MPLNRVSCKRLDIKLFALLEKNVLRKEKILKDKLTFNATTRQGDILKRISFSIYLFLTDN